MKKILFSILIISLFCTEPFAGVAGSKPSKTSISTSIENQFSNNIANRYFIFYSNIPQQKLKAYADFSNSFYEYIDREFIKIRGDFPMRAYVLRDQQEFANFLRKNFQIDMPPHFGTYLQDKNVFVTWDGSGLGTFAHEIMHAVVEQSLRNRPDWAMEGIPSFLRNLSDI